jgi:hypothetical protein
MCGTKAFSLGSLRSIKQGHTLNYGPLHLNPSECEAWRVGASSNLFFSLPPSKSYVFRGYVRLMKKFWVLGAVASGDALTSGAFIGCDSAVQQER